MLGNLRAEAAVIRQHPFIFVLVILLLLSWAGLSLFGFGGIEGNSNCSMRESAHSNQVEDAFYDKVMSLRFENLEANRVALITISAGNEPMSVLTNTCFNRSFLSELIPQLKKLGSKLIAIDQSFSADSCPDTTVNEIFTKALRNAGLPIVVGQAVHPRSDAADENFAGDCLVETKPLNFGGEPANTGAGMIHFGLLTLNENTLKIPLRWWVFRNEKLAKKQKVAPDKDDSFALVAARQVRDDIDQKVKPFVDKDRHPYASFVKKIPTWSAMDVLCYGGDKVATRNTIWGNCDDIAHAPFELKDKVVVVGEHVDSDLQPFPGREKYGSDLHANYIEALLEDTYVRTADWRIDYGFIVVFIGLSLLFEVLNIRKIGPEKIRSKFVSWFSQFALFSALVVAFGFLLHGGIFLPHFFLSCFSIGMTLLLTFALLLLEWLSKMHPRNEE